MNTPISFETAKLLKEKGFDEICNNGYNISECFIGEFVSSCTHKNTENIVVSAPTIAEVVMWLYEKYNIWITVQPNEPYTDNDWCFILFRDLQNCKALEGYKSPTKAYEAAIEYTLTKILSHEKKYV